MLEVDSLKNQSVGELVKLARKLQDELVAAKFQHATQQYKTPHKLRELRRDIARVKTFATQARKKSPDKVGVPKAKPAPAPKAPKVAKAAAAPKTEKAPKAEKAAAKKPAKKAK